MSPSESTQSPFSAAELDEAAVWLARLHAPDRTASLERGFRRWLAETPSHAAAFETISNGWELAGALERRPLPQLTRRVRAAPPFGFLRFAAAGLFVAALCAVIILYYVRANGIATEVGEQRVLTLEDGTRVSLNTASRVVVNYTEHERRLDLQQGEALFEVAKDPARPFIVTAGDRQVRALGTAFVVRREEQQLAVTLIEGKVAVASVTLAPGQRLTFADRHAPTLDRPSIEKVTAWRRGQIELEQATLADAVVEMNRYSAIKLAIASPQAAALRVNGVFRAGDTAGFAAAVARAYGLTVEHRSEQLLLSGAPSAVALTETPAP